MPIVISTKAIIKAGAVASAIAAICGVAYASIPVARGLLNSDAPPLAGKNYVLQKIKDEDEQVAALSAAIKQIQESNRTQSTIDANTLKVTDLTRQQFLESELTSAQMDATRSPSHAATQYVCGLIRQINQLRPVNGLPLIPWPKNCNP